MAKAPSRLKRARIVVLDRGSGRPLAGIPIAAAIQTVNGRKIPLGVLASDHAGYVSFDLRAVRVPAEEIAHVWIEQVGDDAPATDVGPESQLDPDRGILPIFTTHAPGQIHVPRPSLPSIQGVESNDCFLSPYSFSTNPDAKIGEGGCEILLPSNSATHEFRFRQVIRSIDAVLVLESENPNTDDNTVDEFWAPVKLRLPKGYVLEYKVTWHPLGHSLGRLLYSLPLAPCESVNLAVIDWSRKEEARRDEILALQESLVHEQRRDRMIEETVRASLDEWQGGGSLMGGISGSYGAGSGMSLSGAIGGSYASSGGERDLSATTLQTLADSIVQASRAVRTLRSTVVTQVSQQEREVIQTRIVTNHNHCHALTILYYEVLRHYRVVTELVSKQAVLLVDYDVTRFDEAKARCFRDILERVLLDPRLRSCFDALERLKYCTPASLLEETVEATAEAAGQFIDRLLITVVTEDATDYTVKFLLNLVDGDVVTKNLGDEHFGENERHTFTWEPDQKIRPEDIRKVGFRFVHDTIIFEGEWRAKALLVRYVLEGSDQRRILYEKEGKDHFKLLEEDGAEWWDSVTAPAGEAEDDADDRLRKRVQADKCCAARLLGHLNCHKVYYWNAVWLLEDPNQRLWRFRTESPYKEVGLLNHIENRPLAALGDMIAFPALGKKAEQPPTDDQGEPVEPKQRCVSLPTQGVFAEAQLGHCNSCEERDVTRFWNWKESPCPHPPPPIAPIVAGSRAQTVDLQPSAMPAPIVNIANPPAAPDPIGLAAALNVLGTADLFRDMSGLSEVSALLQSLSEGTIGLEEASNRARTIKNRPGGSTAAPAGETATERHNDIQLSRNANARGEVSDEDHRAVVRDRVGVPPAPPPDAPRDLRTIDLHLRAFVPYELWEPAPAFHFGFGGAIPVALQLIRFNGDNRTFGEQGSSRVDLPVRVVIDANDMSFVESEETGFFGLGEVYLLPPLLAEPVEIAGAPGWGERKPEFAIRVLSRTLQKTPANLRSTVSKEGDNIVVRLHVEAKPHFPLTADDLVALPDANVPGTDLNLREAARQVIQLAGLDIDADLEITLRRRSDGALEYKVGGQHDGFPYWELYVNGHRAYTFDQPGALGPENLLPPAEVSVVSDFTLLPTGT